MRPLPAHARLLLSSPGAPGFRVHRGHAVPSDPGRTRVLGLWERRAQTPRGPGLGTGRPPRVSWSLSPRGRDRESETCGCRAGTCGPGRGVGDLPRSPSEGGRAGLSGPVTLRSAFGVGDTAAGPVRRRDSDASDGWACPFLPSDGTSATPSPPKSATAKPGPVKRTRLRENRSAHLHGEPGQVTCHRPGDWNGVTASGWSRSIQTQRTRIRTGTVWTKTREGTSSPGRQGPPAGGGQGARGHLSVRGPPGHRSRSRGEGDVHIGVDERDP